MIDIRPRRFGRAPRCELKHRLELHTLLGWLVLVTIPQNQPAKGWLGRRRHAQHAHDHAGQKKTMPQEKLH